MKHSSFPCTQHVYSTHDNILDKAAGPNPLVSEGVAPGSESFTTLDKYPIVCFPKNPGHHNHNNPNTVCFPINSPLVWWVQTICILGPTITPCFPSSPDMANPEVCTAHSTYLGKAISQIPFEEICYSSPSSPLVG